MCRAVIVGVMVLFSMSCTDAGDSMPSVAGGATQPLLPGPGLRLVVMNMAHLEYGVGSEKELALQEGLPDDYYSREVWLHLAAIDFLREQAPISGDVAYSLNEVDFGYFGRTGDIPNLPTALPESLSILLGSPLSSSFAPAITYPVAEEGHGAAPGESNPYSGSLALSSSPDPLGGPSTSEVVLVPQSPGDSEHVPSARRAATARLVNHHGTSVWLVTAHLSPCRDGVTRAPAQLDHLLGLLSLGATAYGTDVVIVSGDLNLGPDPDWRNDLCPAEDTLGESNPRQPWQRFQSALSTNGFAHHASYKVLHVLVRDPALRFAASTSQEVLTRYSGGLVPVTETIDLSDHGRSVVVDFELADAPWGNTQFLPAIIRL